LNVCGGVLAHSSIDALAAQLSAHTYVFSLESNMWNCIEAAADFVHETFNGYMFVDVQNRLAMLAPSVTPIMRSTAFYLWSQNDFRWNRFTVHLKQRIGAAFVYVPSIKQLFLCGGAIGHVIQTDLLRFAWK